MTSSDAAAQLSVKATTANGLLTKLLGKLKNNYEKDMHTM